MYRLLDGITVLDVTTIIFGPYASQILADLGARVIKIEGTDGDLARYTSPAAEPGLGAMFANNNRNKLNVALDLKSDGGREVMRRLVARADCILHNMRPSAMKRLGFGFEACTALNPRIVYCAAVGFGNHGPYAGRPAFDDIVQAASGLASLTRVSANDSPRYFPSVIADKVAALHVAYSALAALLSRERKGHAIEVEIPMFESLASFVLNEHLGAATFDAQAAPGYHRMFSPDRRPYRTKDGWIAALPYTGEQWRRFLIEIGRRDVTEQQWLSNSAERNRRVGELYGILASAMPDRMTAEWLETLEHLDIPHARVNDLDDLLRDPHLEARGFFAPPSSAPIVRRSLAQPATFRNVEQEPDTLSLGLGADTAFVLGEYGFSTDEIAIMAANGSIVVGDRDSGKGEAGKRDE